MNAPAPALDVKAFRSALGAFTTGVTIITTRGPDGRDVGLTANSFNSVSLDPPMVLWSIAKTSASLPVFMEAEAFAVHILAAHQEHLANTFSRRDVDRFAGLQLSRGHGDVPLIEACAARFECQIAHRYEGGDHMIIVGEVKTFERFERPVLAFHAGKYALALQRTAAKAKLDHPPEGEEALVDTNELNLLLGVAHQHMLNRLAPALKARGLNEHDYWRLNIIGGREGRTVGRLNEIFRFTGKRHNRASLAKLARFGLISIDGAGAAATVELTAAGREHLVELAAASKAAETAMEAGLDYAKGQLMWQLLRRFVLSLLPLEPGE
jgi:3-hydroxy-9,10-secoandrosta-1,3,5(10)-triene-9,17-dione monooxygenase reductase component